MNILKKSVVALLAFLTLLLSFAFFACTDGNDKPITDENTEDENLIKDDEVETGEFYTVTEAYENGYLTREDIMSIAYYHIEQYPFLKEEIDVEDYTPLPKNPEELSAAKQAAIKKAHLNFYYKNEDLNRMEEFLGEKLSISICGYYGTYNGCIVVMTTDNFTNYGQALWTETVADVDILYNDGNRIRVWVKQ